ncbi:hypothetical protein [Geodermatophilus sp. DSM 45219]|uniref:hypothetical protein n=1 Tax=Geodermatophilus sp. DSM 45219 TaxID=1881103 RepID=UPI000B84D43E|nr:hypothetical protein [Geodermatophilus sp. DSM 45219]
MAVIRLLIGAWRRSGTIAEGKDARPDEGRLPVGREGVAAGHAGDHSRRTCCPREETGVTGSVLGAGLAAAAAVLALGGCASTQEGDVRDVAAAFVDRDCCSFG